MRGLFAAFHNLLDHRLKPTTLLLAFALLTSPLAPALAADEVPTRLTGETSAGFLNTTGNTRTRSLNGKAAADYKGTTWTHGLRLAALIASQEQVTTDERYSAGYRSTYERSAADYFFGSLDYDNDRFSGVIQRTTEGVGYGRHILRGPVHLLDVELGVGATQQKLAGGERNDAVVGLLNGKYQWRISNTSTFTQTLKVEESNDNTFINPISELKLVIAGSLFATLGYETRTNTQVPAGTQKTDTLTSVNLGYSFGRKPA